MSLIGHCPRMSDEMTDYRTLFPSHYEIDYVRVYQK